MRLAIQPGRGGRDHPSLPKPKYMHQAYANSLTANKQANLRNFDKPQAKLDEKNDTVNSDPEIANELERGDEIPNEMITNFFKDSITSTTEPEDMNAPQNRCKPLLSTTELRALKANRKFNKTSAKTYYKDTSSYRKTEFKKQKVREKRNYWNILMEDPQEEKQQFFDDNYSHQNANRDVEMEEKQDDDLKARQLCDQIGQLCKYLKIDFKETTKDPIFDLEMRLDKLQCKKVLVQAFGSKSGMVENPPPKGKEQGSFHKDFITEAQHNKQSVKPKRVQFVDTKAPAKKLKETFHEEINTKLNVVTPVKGFERNDQSEEKSNDEEMLEKRCEKIRDVIKGIADELNVKIPETTRLSLMKGDLTYLQMELGGWNIRKREMLKAKKRAKKSEPQLQNKASLYGESGLDVAAVSMNVATKAPVMKNKPPVVQAPRKNVLQKGVNQIRHSYTVRLKLQQQETHVNVSQKLKEIFNVWKSADQSSILLAYDDENNSALMIDDVNKIPYDEQEVNKYIKGMYQYNGKLHFSLRISGHQNLRHLKLHVFKWMRANNGFASIDRIKAAMVHTIGFFHSMHPDFYNREQFKIHIKEYLKPLEIGDDVNVFPRKTWMHHNGQKIETRALVLEVPKVHKDIVNEKMLQYQYRNCPNLTYVPFTNMQDEEHQKTMKQIFYSHNIYLHKVERRTVYGISYPTKTYELLNGDRSSFQEWVSTITYGGDEFLEACEIGPTGNLHLIYDEKHEKTVKLLFGNDFKSLARAHFKHDDVEEIFQKKQIAIEAKSRAHVSEAASDYLLFLKRKFDSPQRNEVCNENTQVTKTKTYAQASKEPPLKMNKLNLHYSASFSPSPPPSESQNLQIVTTLQQVLKRVESLETHKGKNDNTAGQQLIDKGNNTALLEERLNKKMRELDMKFNTALSDIEERTDQRMRESENMVMSKFEELHIAYSEDIKKSFDARMTTMNSTLEGFMTRLESKIVSTRADDTQMSGVSVPGKNQ